MTRATNALAVFCMMVAQACGGPVEGPEALTGKGDTGEEAVAGARCEQIGAISGVLTCTAGTREVWGPHVWSKIPCRYDGYPIARGTRSGDFVCVDTRWKLLVDSPSIAWDPEVYFSEDGTASASEGQACEAIDAAIGPLVCTAAMTLEWVPSIWSEEICYFDGYPIRGDAEVCKMWSEL